jgi:hypothetical protein
MYFLWGTNKVQICGVQFQTKNRKIDSVQNYHNYQHTIVTNQQISLEPETSSSNHFRKKLNVMGQVNSSVDLVTHQTEKMHGEVDMQLRTSLPLIESRTLQHMQL